VKPKSQLFGFFMGRNQSINSLVSLWGETKVSTLWFHGVKPKYQPFGFMG
jgi:hypothetical protein